MSTVEQTIAVFGRLAEHKFVVGTTYTADHDSPFSLWIMCQWARRLLAVHPQWEPIFGGGTSVTREEFGRRLRDLPFKYPITTSNRAVEAPAHIAAALGLAAGSISSALGAICETSDGIVATRAAVQRHFDHLAIEDSTIDQCFALLGGVHGAALTRGTFETRILQLAMENVEIESDPVIQWEWWLKPMTN